MYQQIKIKRLHIQIGVEALATYLGKFFAVYFAGLCRHLPHQL